MTEQTLMCPPESKSVVGAPPDTANEFVRAQLSSVTPIAEERLSIEPIEALAKMLKANAGLFLGDEHGANEIPSFIASNIAGLKEAGVETFFIEMFCVTDQQLLDDFERTGNRGPLEQYLKDNGWGEKGPGWVEKVVDIVEAAKINGIKVAGIDIPHTGETRLQTSNSAWAETVRSTMKTREGKYIIYGGKGHSSNYLCNQGINQLLHIPAIDFALPDDDVTVIRNSKGEYEKIADKPGVYQSDGMQNDLIIMLYKDKCVAKEK